jgi:hypothetical protein
MTTSFIELEKQNLNYKNLFEISKIILKKNSDMTQEEDFF